MGMLYSRADFERDKETLEAARALATRRLLAGEIDSWTKMRIDRGLDELERTFKNRLAGTRLILSERKQGKAPETPQEFQRRKTTVSLEEGRAASKAGKSVLFRGDGKAEVIE